MYSRPLLEWNQSIEQKEADQKFSNFQFPAIEFIFFISIIFLNVQKCLFFSNSYSLKTINCFRMSEFKVRSGALKLKGEEDLLAKKAKKKAKKEKKKAKKRKLDEKPDVHQLDETVHGGWYRVST